MNFETYNLQPFMTTSDNSDTDGVISYPQSDSGYSWNLVIPFAKGPKWFHFDFTSDSISFSDSPPNLTNLLFTDNSKDIFRDLGKNFLMA